MLNQHSGPGMAVPKGEIIKKYKNGESREIRERE